MRYSIFIVNLIFSAIYYNGSQQLEALNGQKRKLFEDLYNDLEKPADGKKRARLEEL